ncbi:MAG TPA: proteasome activator [Acidimicrobiia bacterium]|nr:proteasome activator [Acidimicrobiia bacterium]
MADQPQPNPATPRAADPEPDPEPAPEPAPEKAQFELVDAPAAADSGAAERDESVVHPSKLIRIASMVRNMLEEVRRAPLDDAGRRLLRAIHERSINELEGVLSEDLKAELAEVVLPFTAETPTESELRIAQAQLVGWLEGLFHGIQATIFSQQMTMQQQLEEMRQRKALESGGPERTGPYL